ncbi:MAG TPA: hypothetical protein VGM30_09485 [Puia sp.]|jgi:hypothetical protein
MNTEAMNALKQIRDAIGQIQEKLKDPSLTVQEKGLLSDTLDNLIDQEDTIINTSLQTMVDKLTAANTDLQSLITQMQKASAKIAAFSGTIRTIMNVTGILAEITTKALSAGLL